MLKNFTKSAVIMRAHRAIIEENDGDVFAGVELLPLPPCSIMLPAPKL